MAMLYDRATISGPARITRQGYFVADALVARANNIQDYRAAELGLTDREPNAVIRVFRPEAEVFAVDSLRSASRLPITLDHPPVMVDAKNWREFAKGESGEEILRDGEFMRVPLRVTDAQAVESVQTDHQEFSLGYTATIQFQPGEFNGQAYDAVATNLRYNHLAACRAARGGPELRIVDERPPVQEQSTVKNILVDGLPVNVADASAAEATISKLIADRDAAVQDQRAAAAKVTEHETTIAARDAEIANLKDAVAAAQLSPAQIRDAAANFARTVDTAKRLGATVTDEMDEAAVVQAAVAHKLGDKAASYNAEQARTAFDVLAAGLGDTPPADPLRSVLGDGAPANIADARAEFQKARDARFNRYGTAHSQRGSSATAA
jgi:hypothetical protein